MRSQDHIITERKSGEMRRPIHYLGSKMRLIDPIIAAINELDPKGLPVCDLFSGSGSVALGLSKNRHVTAVDIQEYARILSSAALCPAQMALADTEIQIQSLIVNAENEGMLWAAAPLIEYEENCLELARCGNVIPLCMLIETGSILTAFSKPFESQLNDAHIDALEEANYRLEKIGLGSSLRSMTFRHFGGTYFSFRQAAELDVLLDFTDEAQPLEKDTRLAALLSTASEIVNTVGKQFAQPLRPRQKDGHPKPSLYKAAAKDRYKSTVKLFLSSAQKYLNKTTPHYHHRAVSDDYVNFLQTDNAKIGIVYADPPYTRDHYSRFYHVLETLSLRDNPNVSMTKVRGETKLSRGIYRSDRHQSPFCIKSQAPAAFDQLFSLCSRREVPLVLSYSPFSQEENAHPRVVSIETIEILANKYFSEVEIRSVGKFSHSKLNNSSLAKTASNDAEKLFLCKP